MNHRYQKVLESFVEFIVRRDDVFANKELREMAFSHLGDVLYRLGFEDGMQNKSKVERQAKILN